MIWASRGFVYRLTQKAPAMLLAYTDWSMKRPIKSSLLFGRPMMRLLFLKGIQLLKQM